MEEKNELNDIILNKGGASGNSKKFLLAIATLTLILIIVLVIMNSLKSESDQQAPKAVLPPEPTSPTEIIDDPLFEPVEVIQEGQDQNAGAGAGEDLNQIAQKIKQESMQPAGTESTTVPVEQVKAAPVSQPLKTTVKPAPVVQPVQQTEPVVAPKPVPAKTAATIKTQPAAVKPAPVKTAPAVKNEPAPKPAPTATIKQIKAAEPKPVASQTADTNAPTSEPKAESAPKTANTGGTYYIQVGSFTKQPNQTLFDRLNASGLKYTTVPAGNATKVMVGPFQGEKAARDVLGTVRKNVEPGAYITKG